MITIGPITLLIILWLVFGGPSKYKVTWKGLLVLCLVVVGGFMLVEYANRDLDNMPAVSKGLPDSGPERKAILEKWGR